VPHDSSFDRPPPSLNDLISQLQEVARRSNGLAVLWEHRFYGESLPYPVNDTTGLAIDGYDAYQYLTTEQALEDAVFFAQHFRPDGFSDEEIGALSPSKTPWLFIGGSYPGARAAFSRIRNPEIWYASWSSSGPVQATVDMAVYSEQIGRDIPSNCSTDIRVASEYLDYVLQYGSEDNVDLITGLLYLANQPQLYGQLSTLTDAQLDAYYSQYSNIGAFTTANYLYSIIPGEYQSLGFEQSGLRKSCDIIESFDPSGVIDVLTNWNSTSLRALIDSLYNANLDGIPSDAGIGQSYNSSFLSLAAVLYAIGYQRVLAANSIVNLNNTVALPAVSRSWDWQYCSEFGFFQGSNACECFAKYFDCKGISHCCSTAAD
jgi:hypothetical protein